MGHYCTIRNPEATLINPRIFTIPISTPNTLGRDAEYQEQLNTLLEQTDNFFISAEYWNSVTAKMATPTKVDSKLSDAHLELLKRREGEEGMPLRPGVESSAVGLHKRFYLASTG